MALWFKCRIDEHHRAAITCEKLRWYYQSCAVKQITGDNYFFYFVLFHLIWIQILWCYCRLRAHHSAGSHGTSVARPLHRHIQAQASGVLCLLRATEGPWLSELNVILKNEIQSCRPFPFPSIWPFPLWIPWDVFPDREWAERRPTQAERVEGWPVERNTMKTCRNSAGLNTNQLLFKGMPQLYLRCSH